MRFSHRTESRECGDILTLRAQMEAVVPSESDPAIIQSTNPSGTKQSIQP